MNQSQHLSLSGPDASKIGTDLGLIMGAIMSGRSGTVSVLPPQVASVDSQLDLEAFLGEVTFGLVV